MRHEPAFSPVRWNSHCAAVLAGRTNSFTTPEPAISGCASSDRTPETSRSRLLQSLTAIDSSWPQNSPWPEYSITISANHLNAGFQHDGSAVEYQRGSNAALSFAIMSWRGI